MRTARMLALMLTGMVTLGAVSATGANKAKQLKEKAHRDKLRIAVQGICPVSGQRLGSHGKPIKARVGKLTVFLCCQGCMKGKIKREHWATIHRNIAKAQKICPVMKHKLPTKPKWAIVEGQLVFICCPPCTKKLAAEPAKYLRKLDELYAQSLRVAKTAAKPGSKTK